ncbi:MAG: type II toxin-antitoxin system prevent-host-death family antitoxin [Syntrophaceae bacterium]|nr:type II toxin-antitoxin system prevent-host-death family antitoxin [Syntrophaceae bacterium]
MEISVKEARSKFKFLLDQVEGGNEVVIRRRGKEVARLVPPKGEGKRLPSLERFRSSIKMKGEPLSEIVKKERGEGRY